MSQIRLERFEVLTTVRTTTLFLCILTLCIYLRAFEDNTSLHQVALMMKAVSSCETDQFIRDYDAISQKTSIFIVTAVNTWRSKALTEAKWQANALSRSVVAKHQS